MKTIDIWKKDEKWMREKNVDFKKKKVFEVKWMTKNLGLSNILKKRAGLKKQELLQRKKKILKHQKWLFALHHYNSLTCIGVKIDRMTITVIPSWRYSIASRPAEALGRTLSTSRILSSISPKWKVNHFQIKDEKKDLGCNIFENKIKRVPENRKVMN